MSEVERATPTDEGRARLWLALGAALGLAAVVVGLLAPGERLPRHAVARVNGRLIATAEYERALLALAEDRRAPLTRDDRARVLERLIEEELLVQHALDLELPRHDLRVRASLVAAAIEAVVAVGADAEPTSEEIERFYREYATYFARPARARVEHLRVRAEPERSAALAEQRAHAASLRLRAGERFDEVRRDLGDPEPAPVPDTLLPQAKLREYVGPELAQATFSLAEGEVSAPLRSPQGYSVVVLRALEPGRTPPLEEVRAEVRAELVRRSGDAALRSALADLKRRADIVFADGAP